MATSPIAASTSQFQFATADLDPETFAVARFAAREAISEPFRVELDLVSREPDVNFAAVLGSAATFTRLRASGDAEPIHGIVASFVQAGRSAEHTRYRAVLVPRLWTLGLSRQSRVFQNVTLEDLIGAVLKGGGITDADVSLTDAGPAREYVVQYEETDLAFLTRQLERVGAWYTFEHAEKGRERVVISDDRSAFAPIDGEPVSYREGAGFARSEREAIERFTIREHLTPEAVVLRDYNYRTPETDLEATVEVPGTSGDGAASGEAYGYATHHKTPEEGQHLARVRAEGFAARQRQADGAGDCAGFRAGYLFSLADHYRADLDGDYLLTEVLHAGSQTAALGLPGAVDGFADPLGRAGNGAAASGVSLLDTLGPAVEPSGDGAAATTYLNQFRAVPAAAPYRPELRTPRPRVSGVLTARVESAGGPYAYLDEDGRYRARMGFDRGAEPEGHATRPIRMAQPYSGPGYGMHFPNHAGTELVFACIDGDPDRPLALGTVPNPSQASPAVAANRMQNVIRTFAGAEMVMDDTQNAAFVRLASPDQNALLLDDDKNLARLSTTGRHTVTLDDDNRRIEVRSTSGHLVILNDEADTATVQTKSGHYVTIDDAAKTITISDAAGSHTVTVDGGNSTIALDSAGSITLTAGGAVEVKCATFDVSASGGAAVDAATVDLKAGGALTAKGASVTSQASGSHTTKGASVTSQAAGANTVKGASTTVEGAITTVKGGLVKIN